MGTSKIIVEIETDELDLIATMLHVILRKDPEHRVAQDLLQNLSEQTNTVTKDNKKHGFGPNLSSKAVDNVKTFTEALNEEE